MENGPSTQPSESDHLLGTKKQDGFINELIQDFGWKFLTYLFCAQHMTKGFVMQVTEPAFNYIMKEYSVPAPQMSKYNGVVMLPWALKPVLGIISDTCPIYGHCRLPYIASSAAVGMVVLLALSAFRQKLSVNMYVVLLILVAFYISTTDLMSEAIYSRKLRAEPAKGPALLSYIWSGMLLANGVALMIVGSVLEHGSPWNLYLVAVLAVALTVVPTTLNWMGEIPLSPIEAKKQQHFIWQQKEILVLAMMMLISTITLYLSGMHLDTGWNAVVSTAVTLIMLTCFGTLLNPIIAKVSIFALTQHSLQVQTGSAAFYFMTDTHEQYADGPHFTPIFYNTVLPIVGGLTTLVGVWMYKRTAGTWTYQRMYVVGNLLACFCAVFDIVFFSRVNKRWGIPDHIFIIGGSAIQNLIIQWSWMPSVALLSQLCPKGMEAIMYANLAGCANLGLTVSANYGALLLEILHVKPEGTTNESHQFDNLWLAALMAAVMPLIPVLLIPQFIPNKLNTERILDLDTPVNKNSLLRLWCGWEADAESRECDLASARL